MTRRNNSRRRRSYGRRQHELRERRPGREAEAADSQREVDDALELRGGDAAVGADDQDWRTA